ncbi:tRNA-dihydrouridine synthase 3 [Mycoemilia scoparia]|uniref:tRNA-dihydrouridine(47) synthase [NAD(P)(+)] n=1 Tax=Mycoemilia scoparia TaxID=417184 RepID=A0A9W8DU88_9FUNG|nr:tRNA-dihydrouridine synthase 3 [Mycoemilia scoparia]
MTEVEKNEYRDTWEKGIAPIKKEYLIPREKQTENQQIQPQDLATKTESDDKKVDSNGRERSHSDADEPDTKKSKTRARGQIKDRKKIMKKAQNSQVTNQLCGKIAAGKECPFKDTCKFNHDVEAYLKNRPKDLEGRCVNFDIYGRCSFGVRCRFSGCHTKEDGKQIVNQELVDKKPVYVENLLDPEIRKKLRKNMYDFHKTRSFLKVLEKESIKEGKPITYAKNADLKKAAREALEKEKEQKNGQVEDGDKAVKVENKEPTTTEKQEEAQKSVVESGTINAETIPDEMTDRKERKKKSLDFKGKSYLAPLTTVGNLPFRRICKEFGVDITCSEMCMATNVLQGQQSELALLKRHPTEDLFGVQVCGNRPDVVGKACEFIDNEFSVDFIDLNMGCPVDDVFNFGGGSGLMRNLGKMSKIIRTMDAVTECPITVKYRTGITKTDSIAHKLTPKVETWGAAIGTLHGRSRQQRYTKLANWEYIAECRKTPNSMPLFGNGDVLSWEDYWEHVEKEQADGVMIGRGALIKPWIFQEIKERKVWDISSNERLDILKKFCNYGYEHWGTDERGLSITRKFLCEWQSFLHRYVPAGLLEVLPQKINDRPPPFYGRDELETLMGSPQVSDWIKITERIMGPSPDDFVFVPKHKANAYEG